jgi:hypothetical protein
VEDQTIGADYQVIKLTAQGNHAAQCVSSSAGTVFQRNVMQNSNQQKHMP